MNEARNAEPLDFTGQLKRKGFRAYEIGPKATSCHSYNPKEVYKISLNTGTYAFHYADRSFETEETILFFGNPRIPYSCEIIDQTGGYACLFTNDFLHLGERSESILQSPLFKIGGTPVLRLNPEQKAAVDTIFQKMIAEQETDYAFKDELTRNYIHLLVHEALKMQPSDMRVPEPTTAGVRISALFLELLERQFPIESVDQPLQLKTAQDYARQLSVHVNHLNSSVKEVTGKPTTAHIADRIISEAKSLLHHTTWSIADIAYALGFEYPTYFTNFFKKKTGQSPKSLRVIPSL
jgi:AraC-like DNA-binding protein